MRWSTCLVVIIGLIKCGAKLTWIESVASSDRHTFVVSGGMYISSLATGFGMCNLMDCPKDTIVSAVLPVIVPLDQSANVAFRAQALTHLGNQKCSAICSIADDHLKRHSDILVIVTTCNHIDATMDALSTLRDNSDKFDLVIIDDYSIDGTSDILIKHVWGISMLDLLLNYSPGIFCCSKEQRDGTDRFMEHRVQVSLVYMTRFQILTIHINTIKTCQVIRLFKDYYIK